MTPLISAVTLIVLGVVVIVSFALLVHRSATRRSARRSSGESEATRATMVALTGLGGRDGGMGD